MPTVHSCVEVGLLYHRVQHPELEPTRRAPLPSKWKQQELDLRALRLQRCPCGDVHRVPALHLPADPLEPRRDDHGRGREPYAGRGAGAP